LEGTANGFAEASLYSVIRACQEELFWNWAVCIPEIYLRNAGENHLSKLL